MGLKDAGHGGLFGLSSKKTSAMCHDSGGGRHAWDSQLLICRVSLGAKLSAASFHRMAGGTAVGSAFRAGKPLRAVATSSSVKLSGVAGSSHVSCNGVVSVWCRSWKYFVMCLRLSRGLQGRPCSVRICSRRFGLGGASTFSTRKTVTRLCGCAAASDKIFVTLSLLCCLQIVLS